MNISDEEYQAVLKALKLAATDLPNGYDALEERLQKRIAKLEAELARASEAFDAASKAFAACDIKRYNRIKELEAINQALTASCDDTWHCACIVPLQKRIAELEREKQMYINSTDRLTARVKELEVELRDVRKALEGK